MRHQRQQGPLVGTLILGVLWAGWHLPLFLTEWGRGLGGATPQAILLFVASCLAISVVITWILNKTNESLPVAILLHSGINNFASVLWFAVFTTLNPYDPTLNWVSVIAFGAPALALLVATRGRLGYRPEPDADAPAEAAEAA